MRCGCKDESKRRDRRQPRLWRQRPQFERATQGGLLLGSGPQLRPFASWTASDSDDLAVIQYHDPIQIHLRHWSSAYIRIGITARRGETRPNDVVSCLAPVFALLAGWRPPSAAVPMTAGMARR